jgi:MFS family permease
MTNLRLLGDRNFGPFFFGNLVANCGSWFLMLSASLFVYRATGSAFLLGLVSFSQFVGVFLLVPWTGAAADRFERRRLVFVTQMSAFLLATVLAVLVFTGAATVAVMVGFVLVIGLVQAFTWPALQAMVPDLVAPEHVGAAVSLKALTNNLARGMGPAAAALVIATAGLDWALALSALTYLALVVGLLAIRPLSSPARPLHPKLRQSIAVLHEQPRLAALMLVSSVAAIAIDPVNTLSPAFAVDVWDRPDTLSGVLLAAFSLGALTAAMTVAGRAGRLRSQLIVRLSVLIAGMVAFALAPALEIGLVALVVAGFGFLAASTTALTELQLAVDVAHRGRIMALWSVAFLGVRPFASLADGALASLGGPRMSTLVMTLPALVVVGALLKAGS